MLIAKLHDIDHNADMSDEVKTFELTAKLAALQTKNAEARRYDKEVEDAGEEASEVNEKTDDALLIQVVSS